MGGASAGCAACAGRRLSFAAVWTLLLPACASIAIHGREGLQKVRPGLRHPPSKLTRHAVPLLAHPRRPPPRQLQAQRQQRRHRRLGRPAARRPPQPRRRAQGVRDRLRRPHQAPQPFGPVLSSSRIPAQIADSDAYDTQAIRDWSRFVASCAAFVVVSPQYNGGYPGELKNAVDHLYHEWHGKPVAVVAFGGHGGGKCAAQLQTVFNQVKMRVVPEPVCVTLPRSYITGGDRVPKDGEHPEFLAQYAEAVHEAADKLKGLVAETAAA